MILTQFGTRCFRLANRIAGHILGAVKMWVSDFETTNSVTGATSPGQSGTPRFSFGESHRLVSILRAVKMWVSDIGIIGYS